MSDGPETSTSSGNFDTGQGFTINGGPHPPSFWAKSNDLLVTPKGKLGISSKTIESLSQDQKEAELINAGLLPPLEIRKSQQRTNPTDPELSKYFDNISYGYNSGQVDPRFRQALNSTQTSNESLINSPSENPVQDVPPLNSIPVEEQARWQATYGETHNPDGSPRSTPLTASESAGRAALARTNPAAAAAQSGAGIRQSADPGNPYTYINIDPFDDRYDFKTGQKVRDSFGQESPSSNSSGVNTNGGVSTSSNTNPEETTTVTNPAGYTNSPTSDNINVNQLSAEDELMQQAVAPQRSYDPRGDQIPGSPANEAAETQAAERRLQNLSWHRENVNPAVNGYAGIDEDIDRVLSDPPANAPASKSTSTSKQTAKERLKISSIDTDEILNSSGQGVTAEQDTFLNTNPLGYEEEWNEAMQEYVPVSNRGGR